jgi:hypothetical protein
MAVLAVAVVMQLLTLGLESLAKVIMVVEVGAVTSVAVQLAAAVVAQAVRVQALGVVEEAMVDLV